jgi:hypothetical protein
MRSRLQSDAAGMDEGRSRALRQPLASLIGLQVIDSASVSLGVVVGRVVGDSTVDLLVRRRRLFRRSRYLRLQGDAITMRGRTFVYHPRAVQRHVLPAVIQLTAPGHRARGDAA